MVNSCVMRQGTEPHNVQEPLRLGSYVQWAKSDNEFAPPWCEPRLTSISYSVRP